VIGRGADGRLNGKLIDDALGLVERFVPAKDRAERIEGGVGLAYQAPCRASAGHLT